MSKIEGLKYSTTEAASFSRTEGEAPGTTTLLRSEASISTESGTAPPFNYWLIVPGFTAPNSLLFRLKETRAPKLRLTAAPLFPGNSPSTEPYSDIVKSPSVCSSIVFILVLAHFDFFGGNNGVFAVYVGEGCLFSS